MHLLLLPSTAQLLFYALYAQFFFYLQQSTVNISLLNVFTSVAIYLGIPFILAIVTKYTLWRYTRFKLVLEYISPISLCLVVMLLFSSQSVNIIQLPIDILLISCPLLLYFSIMFSSSYLLGYICHCTPAQSITLAFTAASNNFELAIAISISLFSTKSPQALAATVGPLIEVPIMLFVVVVKFFA